MLTHPVVLTEHVFDKIHPIDLALAEFEEFLGGGKITATAGGGADAMCGLCETASGCRLIARGSLSVTIG